MGRYGEPWVAHEEYEVHRGPPLTVHTDDGPETRYRYVCQAATDLRDRIVACVNACECVPNETLEAAAANRKKLPGHIRAMMYAVLANPDDAAAACCLADELSAWKQDEKYVPRHAMAEALRPFAEAYRRFDEDSDRHGPMGTPWAGFAPGRDACRRAAEVLAGEPPPLYVIRYDPAMTAEARQAIAALLEEHRGQFMALPQTVGFTVTDSIPDGLSYRRPLPPTDEPT